MAEEKQKPKRRKLSKYKQGGCLFCYTELEFTLSHRRGEDLIECPECSKTFSIEEAEKLIKGLSNITEGDCPNCDETLLFKIEERMPDAFIECAICKEKFYLDEAINPKAYNFKKELPNKNKTERSKEDATLHPRNKRTSISPITEGNCPSCAASLTFDTNERQDGNPIECCECGKNFHIEDFNNTTRIVDPNNKYNATAIAAFLLSLFIPILPLFVGIAAINEIKRTGERGEIFAILAIVLSLIQVTIWISLLAL